MRATALLALLAIGCGSSPPLAPVVEPEPVVEAEPEAPVEPPAIVPAGVATGFSRVAYTRDGRNVIVDSRGVVYALDAETLAVRATYDGFGMAVALRDAVLLNRAIWYLATDEVRWLEGDRDARLARASPDGRHAARLLQGRLQLVDVATGSVRSPLAERIYIHLVSFLDDGSELLASTGYVYHRIDPSTGERLGFVNIESPEGEATEARVYRRAYGRAQVPRASWYLTRDRCAVVRVEGEEERALFDAGERCRSLHVRPDGSQGALIVGDGLRVFDARTGETVAEVEGLSHDFTRCNDEPAESLEGGVMIPTSGWRRAFGGCQPFPDREDGADEDLEDERPSGPVRLDVSSDERWEVRLRSDGANRRRWRSWVVLHDTQAEGAGARRELRELRVSCERAFDDMTGDPEVQCDAAALLSDDGASLAFVGLEPHLVLLDLASGERRTLDVPPHVGMPALHRVDAGVIYYAAPEAHGASRDGGAIVRVADGRVITNVGEVHYDDEGDVALTSAEGVRLVNRETFEVRTIARDASAEEWRFSRGGQTLYRRTPLHPFLRIDVANARLLPEATLPESLVIRDLALRDDGRVATFCVEDEQRELALDEGTTRVLTDDAGCRRFASYGPGGAVALATHADAIVVRPDGERLTFEAVRFGERHVWIARDGARFDAPADVLPLLRLRAPGDPRDAGQTPAQGSPLYARGLAAAFLGE